MSSLKSLGTLSLAVCVIVCLPSAASAQRPKVELGASLASIVVGLEDDDVTVFGVPTAGFGFLNPGVYTSFFIGDRLAVEPQVALLVLSGSGDTEHVINFVGQVNYFVFGLDRPSPYVFGAAGVIEFSGSGPTPKSYSVGAGYRIPAGDRLTFRFDGRYTHFTEEGGDLLAFSVALGGLFR